MSSFGMTSVMLSRIGPAKNFEKDGGTSLLISELDFVHFDRRAVWILG